MKTPEEIKMGLACDTPHCEGCPYDGIIECGVAVQEDALAYINQLERENASLNKAVRDAAELMVSGTELMSNRIKELEHSLSEAVEERERLMNVDAARVANIQLLEERLAQVERERDAAVRELKLGEDCDNCKHRNECKRDGFGYKKCTECGECLCSKCEGGESQYEWRGVCEENQVTEENSGKGN